MNSKSGGDLKERGFVKKVLKEFRPSTRLGQHFLVDEATADRIVRAAELSSEDLCLEIGAGVGVLTGRIASRAGTTVAIEIDGRLCEIVERRVFPGARRRGDRIVLLKSDVLKLNVAELAIRYGTGSFKVLSNVPYRITSPIIFWLIENRKYITNAVLTLQQEVAERLTAEPGSKAYGSVTLKVQYFAAIRTLHRIERRSFLPVPEVDSTLVRMDFLPEPPVTVRDQEALFNLIDRSFQGRRKMLRTCLRKSFHLTNEEVKELEMICGIDFGRRGETLSLRDFAVISENMGGLHSGRNRKL